MQGDPTEGALLVAARKCGLSSDELDKRLPRVGEVPFSSERKLMSTLHRDLEQQTRGIVFTKGAPDVLLTRCGFEVLGDDRRPLTPSRREEILQVNDALAGEALRTLGVAGLWLPADVLEEYAATPDARRTGPCIRGVDRHDRSSAQGGEGRGGPGQRRRDSPADDYR